MTTKEQFATTITALKKAISEMQELRNQMARHEDKLSAREIIEGLEDDLENLLWLNIHWAPEDLYIQEI